MKNEELPKIIPVFPLNNFIIFPKTTVPLNIFEPRYIDMINDSMKSNKLIGIIQPKNSYNHNLPILSMIYRIGETKINLNILTSIPQSGIVFLEGESGIGKSTFLKFLSGIAEFDDIKQLISDKKWSQLIDNKRILNSVYLNNYFYHEHGPIGEVVLGGEALTEERQEALSGYLQVSELYNSLNITSVNEYLDLPLSKVAASYSTGELSRIIASCLVCRNESIIYVDELFDHIGVETRANILAWFEKTYPKKLMLIISHNTFGNYETLYLRNA